MTPQEELAALRRLAELEAKASGTSSPVTQNARYQAALKEAQDQQMGEMGSFERGRAGFGKAFTDIGQGISQMFGGASRTDVDEEKRLASPLMDTTAGTVGNILGNVAIAAPTVMIPGANTVGGGALVGSVMGALQPVGTNDSRLMNAGLGGAGGAVVPGVIKGAQVGKAALIDPFTEAGRQRIVGGTINRAVDDPTSLAALLRGGKGATPGFEPTAAQVVPEGGLAALERTARAIDPSGFSAIDNSQRAALVNALRTVAGTSEGRAAAVAAREATAKPLYDAAKAVTTTADDDLKALLSRPSMKDAWARASRLAAEKGEQLAIGVDAPASTATTGILDASGREIGKDIPAQSKEYSGRALHYLKMALDDMSNPNATSGIGKNEQAALASTRDALRGWLEKSIPEYGQAAKAYAQGSRPINQMDIGKELYERFVPALADSAAVPFKSRADALAAAVRGGDDLVRNVTGQQGGLSKVMDPEQLALINGVIKDSAAKAAAETSGRGVGSDTVQKMAMSNLIAETGLPSWMSSLGRVPGGWLRTAGDVLYTKNDEAMRHLLADVLKSPEATAKAMQAGAITPSKLAEILRVGIQPGGIALPAIVNAQQQ